MRSGFVRVSIPAMDDPVPPPPDPVAIPIRIVQDVKPFPPPPPPESVLDLPMASIRKEPRTDNFYDAWDKFLAIEPKRAKFTSTVARKLEEAKENVEKTPGDGLQIEENASLSYEQAAAECRAKVAAIVEECKRLNQKYRDAVFDLETNPYCLQNLMGRYPKAVDRIDPPPWIKRVEDIFDDPQFFIDGATANDVHQGSSGDCWFLAALMAVSAKQELIQKLCVARDEKVGVYGFVFYRDGEWIYEVIDDKLYLKVGDDDDLEVVRGWEKDKKEGMLIKHDEEKLKLQLQRGGEALYFSHCKSNETWLPLIEKAYAKAHGDYFAIEGGHASEAVEDLTGGVGVVINPEDIMDKDRFWVEQLSQVNKKYLFGGGSLPSPVKGMIGSHAYAVLRVWEEDGLRLLQMRNPWGETEWEGDWSDGSKLWTPDMMRKLDHKFGDDGVFWISYKDFLKHFPTINRVRLFDENWQVAQQWTCVNVPWTVDYLDTKFQFTITKQCPVVIVLCQPDDRYFYGLRGRFFYSLHFRVYKEGCEDRWIVRSMHNSGNETFFTRSVSAEIEDLEPGTYNVVFKVTAIRSSQAATADEAVMKFAVERKEKLLHVGRRFDYAQSKGNLKAMEEQNKKRKKKERIDFKKSNWKRARQITQQAREQARKRKQRVEDAMREKRKDFHEKRKEKAKSRRKRILERQETERTDPRTEDGLQRRETTLSEAQVEDASEDKSDSKGDGITPQTQSEVSPLNLDTESKPAESQPAESQSAESQPLEADPKSSGSQQAEADPKTSEAQPEAGESEKKPESPEQGRLEIEAETKPAASQQESGKDDKKPEEVVEIVTRGVSELRLRENGTGLTRRYEVRERPTEFTRRGSTEFVRRRSTEYLPRRSTEYTTEYVRERPTRFIETDDESEYESSIEPPEQMENDDFDWDSDLDGPIVDSSEDDDLSRRCSASGGKNAIFGDDPWNAMCVLGLRVYSLNADAKITVIKGENSS